MQFTITQHTLKTGYRKRKKVQTFFLRTNELCYAQLFFFFEACINAAQLYMPTSKMQQDHKIVNFLFALCRSTQVV